MKRFILLLVILSLSAVNLAAQSRRQVDAQTHSEIVQQLIREDEFTADCVRQAGGYSNVVSVTPIYLNRDREPEFAVQEQRGCAGMWDRQWIYRRTPTGYELLLSLAQRSAFRLLNRYTNGYRDVQVNMAASVSMEVLTSICRFDGSRYRDDYVPPHRPVTPRGKRQTTSVPETLKIVPAGENAPEALIRVVSMTRIAHGKHRVNVVGGPCLSQPKTRLVYIVDTKETLAKGDLFFVVPVSSGWALRRANSREAAQYANCRWRDNEPEDSTPDYRTYIGKDLNDLLRGVPDVNRRLRKLLGRNYQLFMKNLTVSSELQDEQGFLKMHGLAPHMGAVEEAVFLLSFSTGKLHCAILSERFGNRYKLFSEDQSSAPTALIDRLIYR